VIDDNNPITVKHGYTWETEKYQATKYKIPNNGLLELDYFVNDPNATTLGIEVSKEIKRNMWHYHDFEYTIY